MISCSTGVAVVEEGGIALHEGDGELLEDKPSEYRNPRVIHQHNQDQQISIQCKKTA